MGRKYKHWIELGGRTPESLGDLRSLLNANRAFEPVSRLEYGDHGLTAALTIIQRAIARGARIALYADYDVDGTMSCVSWIWFFEAIGYSNYVHYIPCRFKEGYGLNLAAVRHLIEAERAELVITMDTGITANEEAAYCRAQGVEFICTDHHKVQLDKMPDCTILNPKLHPDAIYQELCGCGITFVLLRKLAASYVLGQAFWNDMLALVGMATICDVVPLNGVNHRLAKLGVQALMKSDRPIFQRLRQACALEGEADEKDVGFRIGPRINAVGRLEHADKVIQAFIGNDPEPLVAHMSSCNEQRKLIQERIVRDALVQALDHAADPILFLGGPWHPGVVGIAASKLTETFWKPTWLFQNDGHMCKGSARSLPGFDVTDAMGAAADLFTKFGGHRAAGGFTFPAANLRAIRERLVAFANDLRVATPNIWESKVTYDCRLPLELLDLRLLGELDDMKPFGHGFQEPVFRIDAEVVDTQHYRDKVTGVPRHTAIHVKRPDGRRDKIMFFSDVITDLPSHRALPFLVTASRNTFRGVTSVQLMGQDISLL